MRALAIGYFSVRAGDAESPSGRRHVVDERRTAVDRNVGGAAGARDARNLAVAAHDADRKAAAAGDVADAGMSTGDADAGGHGSRETGHFDVIADDGNTAQHRRAAADDVAGEVNRRGVFRFDDGRGQRDGIVVTADQGGGHFEAEVGAVYKVSRLADVDSVVRQQAAGFKPLEVKQPRAIEGLEAVLSQAAMPELMHGG